MMPVSRRRFLTLLGITPALPVLGKIPIAESPEPTKSVQMNTLSSFTITGAGGWCCPVEPLYDVPRIPTEHPYHTRKTR